MFNGGLDFSGANIIGNIVILLGFLTIVLYLAQDKSVTIPLLDIIQTFLCWPTILEGIHISLCLWCFRHIERLLGTKCFLIYLIYNFITYTPIFLLALQLKGFKGHFSFLFFIPFSLFIFMIWRLPSVVYSGPLTDKFIVCLSFVFVIVLRFPFSILTIFSSAFGYYLWDNDSLMLKRFASIQVSSQSVAFIDPHSSRSHTTGNSNSNEQSPLLAMHDNIENSTEEETYSLPINRNTRENGRRSSRSSSHNDTSSNTNISYNHSNIGNNSNKDTNDNLDSLIEQIVSMGFQESDARSALQTAKGDINAAVDYLLSKA